MMKILTMVFLSSVLLSIPYVAGGSIANPTLREYPHLGHYYVHTGQYDLAISTFRAMIGKYPNSREAEEGWLNLGNCHTNLMTEAMAELSRARARTDASKKEIAELESKVESLMNQALAAYRTVIVQFPKSRAEAIIGTGRVHLAFGSERADEALAEYKKVIDEYPEEAGRAQLLTGDLHAAIGDTEEAKLAYTSGYTSFPEVASLAMLKLADLLLSNGSLVEAADNYSSIIDYLGIENAYDDVYHPLGNVMEKAIAGRGKAERQLGAKDEEIIGYRSAAARYYGTRAGVAALMKTAEALDFYGKGEEAVNILDSIASHYPKSVCAVSALMQLAAMRGNSSRAADFYAKIAENYPQSIFWVDARMKLAETYLKMSDTEKDTDKKKELQEKARNACLSITTRYPSSPEAENARAFLDANNLKR